MSLLKKGYKDLWKAVIRPERDSYSIEELGPESFNLDNRRFKRQDFQLKNRLGLTLECSHFEPVPEERVAECLPCVIYLHGNSSSRLEAVMAVPELLNSNITLFCFDMSGSGLSEGEYISLGWYERDDLGCVVDYLRSTGTVSCIGLWGRSMGAVTALLHGDRDPSIAGMVIDSPFSNLKLLCQQLAKKHASSIPGFVLKITMNFVRKTIKKKAKFDVKNVNPIDYVDRCFIPSFFVAASDDDFIVPSHTQALYEKYAGDKNIVIVEGDHHSNRPQYMLDSVAIFFYNTLQCADLPSFEELRKKNKKKKKKKNREREVSMSEEDMIRMAIEESLKTAPPDANLSDS